MRAVAPSEVVAALGGVAPTEQQWRAISYPLEPCAVIAGAGSGKTAVMAARVVWLALNGVPPSSVLCLTFTNKAAEELHRRVASALSHLQLGEGEEATVATYHSFASDLLDEHGLLLGVEPGQMLLSAAHRWQLATSLLEDRRLEHLEVRTISHPVKQMLGLADQCANHLVDPLHLAAVSRAFADRPEIKKEEERIVYLKRAELAELVHAYQERKRATGAIDYGDQIRLAVQLVRSHPSVVEDFRARYRAVLLDEYQDTNHAQGALLETLIGRDYPVMCVGDPDQNIYAWRGASLRNILEFPRTFGGEVLPLSVNFRSGKRILDAANEIIEPVPAARRAPGKRLDWHEPLGGGRVSAFVAADEHEEAERIAAAIREAAAAGTPYREIAILCRKKRLMNPIRRVLLAEGIPVEVADLGGLLQIPEIVDVVAWLQVLDDPARNIALARVLQGPRWRIGYRDMVALARWSARHNRTLREDLQTDEHPGDVAFALAEALDHIDDEDMTGLSDEARVRLRDFNAVLASLRDECVGPLDELVTAIIERSGLLAELEWRTSPAALGARRNLLNFVGHVAAFAPVEGTATLSTLVGYLDAAEESEGEDFEQAQLTESDAVKLLTIHKAKGLEWDVVFVPGLAEGRRSKIFPDTSRQPNPVQQPATMPFELRGDSASLPGYEGNIRKFRDELSARALEEERRLAYVALTRARKHLIVSSAYWYEGPQDPFAPGPFYEAVAALAERDDTPVEVPKTSPLRARAASPRERPLLSIPS